MSAIAETMRKNPWIFPATIGAIVVLVGGLIFLNMQPKQGTWRYGVCRAFLEFETAYPPTIDILAVAEDRTTARLYAADKNPFGNERIVQVDCDYIINGQTVKLARMSFDRKPIPDGRIAYYNRMLPSLMTQEMNLDLPKPLPYSLNQLKR